MEGHQNCMRNGRPDTGFLYWRWKPRECELPPFDPERFLEMMRSKTWALIGDSISRNHVQSLLCMLSAVCFWIFFGNKIYTHTHMYTVEVQTHALTIPKRIIYLCISYVFGFLMSSLDLLVTWLVIYCFYFPAFLCLLYFCVSFLSSTLFLFHILVYSRIKLLHHIMKLWTTCALVGISIPRMPGCYISKQ